MTSATVECSQWTHAIEKKLTAPKHTSLPVFLFMTRLLRVKRTIACGSDPSWSHSSQVYKTTFHAIRREKKKTSPAITEWTHHNCDYQSNEERQRGQRWSQREAELEILLRALELFLMEKSESWQIWQAWRLISLPHGYRFTKNIYNNLISWVQEKFKCVWQSREFL